MSEAPAEVELGSILVSLLDPERGQEVAFHRWYERDHFYSGCMTGEHFFAGRRFVATRALKDERLPEEGAMLPDVRAGSYLALYWIQAGHHAEAEAWSVERVQALIAHDRMFPGRRPVHAGFYRARFTVSRDPDGVPIELALDHPYAGVGLTFWEAPSEAGVADLAEALERRWLPSAWSEGGPTLVLGLAPIPLPEGTPSYVERPVGLDRRLLLVSFHPEDPKSGMRRWVTGLRDEVEAAGLGRLRLAAPFVPTIPGTDRYADELW